MVSPYMVSFGHINPVKIHPEIIKQTDKELVNVLIMIELNFLFERKVLRKIEIKNNICINVFGRENRVIFPIYISDQKFENSMDFLLVINENKSHYVYIKS